MPFTTEVVKGVQRLKRNDWETNLSLELFDWTTWRKKKTMAEIALPLAPKNKGTEKEDLYGEFFDTKDRRRSISGKKKKQRFAHGPHKGHGQVILEK